LAAAGAARASRAVARNAVLTLVEESNAKMLAGPGGCYAFYFDTQTGVLTIGLHLLEDVSAGAAVAAGGAIPAGAGDLTAAYHKEWLHCPAAEDASKACAGEWGVQRCRALQELRRCREALEALQEPPEVEAVEAVAAGGGALVEEKGAGDAAAGAGAGEPPSAGARGAGQLAGDSECDGMAMDVDDKRVKVKEEKVDEGDTETRTGGDNKMEEGGGKEAKVEQQAEGRETGGDVVRAEDVVKTEEAKREEELRAQAARVAQEEEEAQRRQAALEQEREKEQQRRERQVQRAAVREHERGLVQEVMRGVYESNGLETRLQVPQKSATYRNRALRKSPIKAPY